MNRIVAICAALLPVALGLGLVQLFIDGRITAWAASGGVLALVIVAAAASMRR